MENSSVLDFAKSIDSSDNTSENFIEAISAIQSGVRNNYSNPLHALIASHEKETEKNPAREVALLNALSMFVSGESRDSLMNISNLISKINTFNSIHSKLQDYTANTENIYRISSEEPSPYISEKAVRQTEILVILTMAGIL